jgi:hypothetical protein
MVTVQDTMDRSFARLKTDLTVSAGLTQLQAHACEYAIVIDDKDEPIAIVSAAGLHWALSQEGGTIEHARLGDLERWFPPLIRVRPDFSLSTFLALPDAETLRECGVTAWLVEKDGQVVGIFTDQHIDDYLASDYEPEDNLLYSFSIGQPVLAGLNMVCAACGTRNICDFFDQANPPLCRNRKSPPGPHSIVLGWQPEAG